MRRLLDYKLQENVNSDHHLDRDATCMYIIANQPAGGAYFTELEFC